MIKLSIIKELVDERQRQDEKFGPQNHPDGTGSVEQYGYSVEARMECQDAFWAERGTWFHVLKEEFWEAAAAENDRDLREELIQVAAVAVAWVEAIDRRKKQ